MTCVDGRTLEEAKKGDSFLNWCKARKRKKRLFPNVFLLPSRVHPILLLYIDRSLCSLLPEQQPSFGQRQSSLEEAPWTFDFQVIGGWKELIPTASLPPAQPLGAEGGSFGLWGLLPELQPKEQGSRLVRLRRKVREECQASSAQGHLLHPANEDGCADRVPELSRRPRGVGCFSIYWM